MADERFLADETKGWGVGCPYLIRDSRLVLGGVTSSITLGLYVPAITTVVTHYD